MLVQNILKKNNEKMLIKCKVYLVRTLRCTIRKTTPQTMQREPTTIYAIPRNGFLPPIHEVVDKITLFSPLKGLTG